MPPSPPNGYQNFFSQLVKDGYLKLNQKTRIGANEKGIKVDGKTLDERTFTKYKKIIEQCSGKKLDKNFNLEFDGKILDVGGDGIHMSGSYTISD